MTEPNEKRGISGLSSLTRRVTKEGQFVPVALAGLMRGRGREEVISPDWLAKRDTLEPPSTGF